MKLGNGKSAEVLSTEQTKKMSIDTDSMHILQMLLSQNLYQDPVSSIVREYASNAIDAVVESGKNPIECPIIVSTYEEGGNYFFSVKDTGTGLNEEDFDNVISSYLKSTRRDSNEYLGMMGIGSKSGLAYASSYYWICRKDGVERKFVIFKGEMFTEYTKLYERETSEENGTEVIIPIKKEGWSGMDDVYEFEEKMKQQLSYFETVVLIQRGTIVTNKIYREEKFQFSVLNNNDEMHMCLRDVYYELNWDKLGINPIDLPVALRFDLDSGITPNPARESIIYNRETIELIKSRIAEVCKWFIDRYNEKIVERDSFMDIIDELNPYDSKYLEIYGERFNVSLLKDYGELETPKLKGIGTLNVSTLHDKTKYFLYDYNFFGRLESRSWSSKDEEYGGYRRKKTIVLMDKLKAGVPMFVVEEKPTRVLLDYISDKYGDCVFLKKNDKKIPLKVHRYSDKSSWERIVSLSLYPKEKWRTVLQEFKTIKDEVCSRLIDISTVVPDDQWLEDRKKNKKKSNVTKVEKQEINPKYARWHGIIDGEVVFKSDSPQEVSTLTRMCVYGKQEDKGKLTQVFELFNNCLSVCILVDRDIKRTKENNLTNWYSIEEFMEGTHDVFGKFCTAILIDKLRNDNDLVFKNIEFVQRIDEEFATKAQELMDWKREVLYNSRFPEELVTEMMQICEEKDLWIKDKYELYLETKEGIGNFAFIEHLKRERGYGGNRETIDVSDELVQFAKEIYNLKVNKNQEVYNEQD